MQNAIAVTVVAIALVPGVWWLSSTRLLAAVADVEACWADVHAELQHRHRLVGELIESVGADVDQDLLTELVRRLDDAAGAHGTPEAANEFEPPLVEAVDDLFTKGLAAGGRPDDRTVAELDERLAAIDDRVAIAASFYNTRVAQLDRRIGAIASGFVARRRGFERPTRLDI